MSKKASTISALITLSLITISGCDKSGLPASAITAGKYIILDTRTDQADRATAKKNAENTLRKYPDIDAMVGLWAYNIPQCLEALKDNGMEGKVKLISFDEDELTLQGIKDGHVHGTIVQQPYQFGYQSVKYLKALEEGDMSMIPANKMLDIPTKEIKKDNVDEFWTELKTLQQLGETAKAAERPTATGLHFAFVVNLPSAVLELCPGRLLQSRTGFWREVRFQNSTRWVSTLSRTKSWRTSSKRMKSKASQ